MGDDEADKSTTERENSIPKRNQLLKKVSPCCNLNCQTENIQQGNVEESNHEVQGMLSLNMSINEY